MPKLIFFANKYINNESEAEGIVQEVFIKIWDRKNKIHIQTNINSFLYKVTRNACLDYLKSNKNKLTGTSLFQKETLINYRALSDDASSFIIEQELETQINLALEELPEKCRNIFIKSRYEGLKNREISTELKISIKTVENQMTKALRHMRFHLKEYITFL